MKESGELDEMHQRWMVDKSTEMPDIAVPENPAGTLIVGTSGVLVPNSYYQDIRLLNWAYIRISGKHPISRTYKEIRSFLKSRIA
jgi:hypothetical protein